MTEHSSQCRQRITAEELKQRLSEDIALIDVRTEEEYLEGHIPQATNVPLDTIAQYQGDRANTLYVICRSGRRSGQACGILKEKGYRPINVEGGMLAWDSDVEQ